MSNVFTKLTMVIISQCIHTLNHHILQLHILQFLAIILQQRGKNLKKLSLKKIVCLSCRILCSKN